MLGLMQEWPLTVDRILDHAARWHGSREVVTRSVAGEIVRTDYFALRSQARRLSSVLQAWGIVLGDRVATLAWNTDRHMEIWYATMGIGAVCHTLNPRLHPDQLAYIINHAGDRILFADHSFQPMVETIRLSCPSLERVIILDDEGHAALFETAMPEASWGGFAETTACGLCYTSGTTGNPKGVLYSHRSNFLHTLFTLQTDVIGLSARDCVLPVVPMFHANAWGLVFSAPAVGAKLVLPGQRLDGASLYELLETEAVTFSAAVPTIWQGLLDHMDERGLRLSSLRRVVIGGAACPPSLIRTFYDRYGVEVLHAWGMTETSPLGTIAAPDASMAGQDFDSQMAQRTKQGRPPLGVDLRIVDPQGSELLRDGLQLGALQVSGPAVADAYFGRDDALLHEGFFDTGDIASIDGNGFMRIADRSKDLIKSGGEWISSIELEMLAETHDAVARAAAIAKPHEKWDERPLMVIEPKPGMHLSSEDIYTHLEGKIPKWWMPDELIFVNQIPLGATGKVDKVKVRYQYINGKINA